MSTVSPTAPAATLGRRPRPVSSELLKITTTKMWLGMLGGVVAFIALGVVSTIFAPQQPGVTVPRLSSVEGMRNLFASAGAAYVFAIIIGALGMTQEIRHQTLTSTLLAEPHRNKVIRREDGRLLLHRCLLRAVGVVFGYALALALLPLKDHGDIPVTALWQIAGGAVLGSRPLRGPRRRRRHPDPQPDRGDPRRPRLGAHRRGLIVAFLPAVGKWLPGGALNGVLQATGINGATYLPVWQASLVLLGCTALFAVVAALTTQRRDIT